MAVLLYKWCVFLGAGFISLLPDYKPQATSNSNIRTFHPFYISVTEINQNAKNKTFEISCKLFAEDFEETLRKNYNTNIDLSSEKNKPDKLVSDYITKHLGLQVNGKAVVLNYVGYEKEKESVYCYFQVEATTAVKKIEVINRILHDFSDSQINIIHVIINGKRQSTKLEYPNNRAAFTF